MIVVICIWLAQGLKRHHEAVEGQLCEFAARHGVIVDVLLPKLQPHDILKVYKMCLGEWSDCPEKGVLDCFDASPNINTKTHDAIYTRDDECTAGAQELATRLGLPGTFAPGANLSAATSALSFMRQFGNRTAHAVDANCALPSEEALPESAFPLYAKYALGIHSSGGWGGRCVRHMAVSRSRAELARKLPFFCGRGMRRWRHIA